MKSTFIILGLSVIISACSAPVTSMLLTDYKTCSDTESCETNVTTIEGTPDLEPDSSQLNVNVDYGDLVQITGVCKDLGRRNNRILVQVFESEDEATTPYIDNTVSSNCSNSSVAALNGTTCFLVSHGIGLVDSGLQTYPQCFNGRFGFQIRLGKINRQNPAGPLDDTTNPKLKYLVRMKLRTTDGLTADSQWKKTTIVREVSKPQFIPVTQHAYGRCDLRGLPFKFANVGYTLQRSGTAVTGVVPTVPNVYPTGGGVPMLMVYPDLGDGTFFTDFYDMDAVAGAGRGMVPGVTYKYSMSTTDYTYTPNENSGLSSESTCEVDPPEIMSNTNSATSCTLSLSAGTGHLYDFHYSTVAGWQNTSPSATPVPGCIGTTASCTFAKPGVGTFWVAVRVRHNPLGYAGKWSKSTQTVTSCTFP